MFKLHKPYAPGCIHSGHFMVSRLDDDEDNNDPEDDTSESERDNANSVEIDVTNPDSVVDAKNLDINYVVKSPAGNELTSWNDLDRPKKHSQKQYLTYYTSNHHQPSEDIPTDVTQPGAGSSDMCVEGSSQQASQQDQLDKDASDPHRHQQHQQQRLQNNRRARNAYFAQQQHLHQQHLSHQPHQLLQNQRLYQLRHEHQLTERQKQKLLSLSPHQNHANTLEALNAVANHSSSAGGVAGDLLLSSESALQLSQHLQQQQQQCLCSSNQANFAAIQHHHHHHHQHAVTIDTSLTKLLECMSLYYSSNLTSPKWKSFKGLKLRLKYKIRLNNLIWRAWFLQCIRGRRPPGCQFNAPVETDVHKKSETIVLEGKYWKRKEKAIVDEYKKWRIFHKQKSQVNFFRPSSFDWESRASNLATSNLYVQGVDFSPDYDMNPTYNIEEFPQMLDVAETSSSNSNPNANNNNENDNLNISNNSNENNNNNNNNNITGRSSSSNNSDSNSNNNNNINNNNSHYCAINQTAISNTRNHPPAASQAANTTIHQTSAAAAMGSTVIKMNDYQMPTQIQVQQQQQQQQLNPMEIDQQQQQHSSASTSQPQALHNSHQQQQQTQQHIVHGGAVNCMAPSPADNNCVQQPFMGRSANDLIAANNSGQTNNQVAQYTNVFSKREQTMVVNPQSSQNNQMHHQNHLHNVMSSQQQQQQQPSHMQPQIHNQHPQQQSHAPLGQHHPFSPLHHHPLLNQSHLPVSPLAASSTNGVVDMQHQQHQQHQHQTMPNYLTSSASASNLSTAAASAASSNGVVGQASSSSLTNSPSGPINAQLSPLSLNSHIARSSRPNSSPRTAPYSSPMSHNGQSQHQHASPPNNSLHSHQSLNLSNIAAAAASASSTNSATPNPIYHPLQTSGSNLFQAGMTSIQQQHQNHHSHNNNNQSSNVRPQQPPTHYHQPLLHHQQQQQQQQHQQQQSQQLQQHIQRNQLQNHHQQQHISLTGWPHAQSSSPSDYQSMVNSNQASSAAYNSTIQDSHTQQQQQHHQHQQHQEHDHDQQQQHQADQLRHQQQQRSHSPLDRDSDSSPNSVMALDLYSPDDSSMTSGGRFNEQRQGNCHVNAEQKRRCNIKNGFDTLKSILPTVSHSVNVKVSKASMLQKAAVFISNLEATQKEHLKEQAMIKSQIESLRQQISSLQAQLPIAGGILGSGRSNGAHQARELLHEHIKLRSKENWKYWVFSLMMEPLFDNYYNTINTENLEESCKSMLTWVEAYCNLRALRKDVLGSLTFLGTRTNVLQAPQSLAQEASANIATRYQASSSGSNNTQAASTSTATTTLALLTAAATSAPSSANLMITHQQQQQQQLQHSQQHLNITQMSGSAPNGNSIGMAHNNGLKVSHQQTQQHQQHLQQQQQQHQHQQLSTWLYN